MECQMIYSPYTRSNEWGNGNNQYGRYGSYGSGYDNVSSWESKGIYIRREQWAGGQRVPPGGRGVTSSHNTNTTTSSHNTNPKHFGRVRFDSGTTTTVFEHLGGTHMLGSRSSDTRNCACLQKSDLANLPPREAASPVT